MAGKKAAFRDRIRESLLHLKQKRCPPRRRSRRLERSLSIAEESQFVSFDGQTLFYRHWPALSSGPRPRTIVLLHRGHEHSGRLQHLVDELQLADTPMFAWDARGHGRNEGPRGYSPSLGATVRDLDCFVRHLCQRHGLAMEEIVVIAQSVGAVLAATWAHDYARACARWCWPRRPSRSSSTCPSPGPASG